MGAFDGLNLYQRKPAVYVASSAERKTKSKEFYVSWDASRPQSLLACKRILSGATGKWFPVKEDAIKCFFEKIEEGVHPACWFRDDRVDNVSNTCNDPTCIQCKSKKAR